MGYAGTLDRFGAMQGKAVLLDIKSGSMLHHPAVAAQLAGYWWLLLNEGFAADQMMALRLDKSGVYELKEEKDGRDLFKACQVLHAATGKKRKKK